MKNTSQRKKLKIEITIVIIISLITGIMLISTSIITPRA